MHASSSTLARELVCAGRAPDRVSGTGVKRRLPEEGVRAQGAWAAGDAAVGLLDIMQGDLKGPIMDELPPSSLGRLA
jgi:hypothetical protein